MDDRKHPLCANDRTRCVCKAAAICEVFSFVLQRQFATTPANSLPAAVGLAAYKRSSNTARYIIHQRSRVSLLRGQRGNSDKVQPRFVVGRNKHSNPVSRIRNALSGLVVRSPGRSRGISLRRPYAGQNHAIEEYKRG